MAYRANMSVLLGGIMDTEGRNVPMNRKQYLLLVALTVLAGLIGGAVSNWVFMARSAVAEGVPTAEEVVLAKRFILADEKGNIRSIWGVTPGDDEVALMFLDKDGKVRVNMGTRSGSAGLIVGDKNEKSRAIMSVNPNGDPMLTLSGKNGVEKIDLFQSTIFPGMGLIFTDKNEKQRVSIRVNSSGTSILSLDKSGKQLANILVDSDGASLVLSDTNTHEAIALAQSRSLGIGLALSDKNRKLRAGILMDSDGVPNVILNDEHGTLRAVLGGFKTEGTAIGKIRTRTESSLILFDKDGKVMWSAP